MCTNTHHNLFARVYRELSFAVERYHGRCCANGYLGSRSVYFVTANRQCLHQSGRDRRCHFASIFAEFDMQALTCREIDIRQTTTYR